MSFMAGIINCLPLKIKSRRDLSRRDFIIFAIEINTTIMKRRLNGIIIIAALLFFLHPCLSSCTRSDNSSVKDDSLTICVKEDDGSVADDVRELLEDNKGKQQLIVDQAVDAWFYYHLNNYESYKALQRSTTYDKERDVYIHKCMYRAMNRQGGIETWNKTFEVNLNEKGENQIPFKVTDISPEGKNTTER